MTDIAELYSDVQKPTWAGSTYKSSIMQRRAFDYEITNTRGNGRDYEISLPRELAEEGDLDRSLPVLINGDTNPVMQVAGVFVESGAGCIRFSLSEKG